MCGVAAGTSGMGTPIGGLHFAIQRKPALKQTARTFFNRVDAR